MPLGTLFLFPSISFGLLKRLRCWLKQDICDMNSTTGQVAVSSSGLTAGNWPVTRLLLRARVSLRARLSLTALFWLAAVFLLTAPGLTGGNRVYAQTSPDISGTWRGTLLAGQFEPLEVVLHIQGVAGNYNATLDIPAQLRQGILADSVSIRGANIMIRINSIQAEYYAGLVMADDGSGIAALVGDWGQSGEHTPLRMQRDPL
jgi:hypothetical protein